MKLRELHVCGFRSLKNTSITGVATKSIFHGDNGSGKSNLLLVLETIFCSKESGPGTYLSEENLGKEIPRHSTPFWRGYIPDFDENFYMGNGDPIKFEVLLLVAPDFLADLDEEGILASLEEEGHDFRVKLKGEIVPTDNGSEMRLAKVEINGKPAMEQIKGGTEWLQHHEARSDAKKRVVESILDAFTDQVRVIPASRYLSEETFSKTEAMLSSGSYKNWLHNMSLSRDGYQTFKRVKYWLSSDTFEIGEISFAREDDRLELMVEDECDYRMKVDHKGSGIQQIIVLLGFIAESDAAIIAVEEPELNLSFSNQDLIVSILRELVDDPNEVPHQILLTSHSDHIGSRDDLSRFHVEKINGTDTIVRHFTDEDRVALFPRKR